MEDRLVQEEIDNGDLTARLDDARNLLRDRGLATGDRARSPRDGLGDSPDEGSGLRTLPAGQPARRRRKPPVARIPGQIDVPSDQDDAASSEPVVAYVHDGEISVMKGEREVTVRDPKLAAQIVRAAK